MMAYHHGDLRRTLVDAARALVSEGQAWDFSLREVARRAGVSHNAPYNHFSDKRELLGEVAASGFRSLQHELVVATGDEPDATKALVLLGKSYIGFAQENPALYRLMFGPVLAAGYSSRPRISVEAGAITKTVLVGVLRRGAHTSAFAINPNDNTEFASKAFLVVTGYDAEEVLGRNRRFFQGEATSSAAVAELRLAIAAGREADVEILNYRKNGSPFWNQLHLGPINDEPGEIAYYFASQIDVTELGKVQTQEAS